jgi:hypothetical protein
MILMAEIQKRIHRRGRREDRREEPQMNADKRRSDKDKRD